MPPVLLSVNGRILKQASGLEGKIMPFPLRRYFKMFPGTKINLTKGGVSASLDAGRSHLNLGKRGVRPTVAWPGTGMSYTPGSVAGLRAYPAQTDPVNYDDVPPDFPQAAYQDGTVQEEPPSGDGGVQLPLGCLIAAGVLVSLCALGVLVTALGKPASSAPQPTLDNRAIGTSAFETALAMNGSTLPANALTTLETATLLPAPTAMQSAVPAPPSYAGVPGAGCIPNEPPQTAKVVHVVDGDTIDVTLAQDGKTYALRYIGMDTPEMKPPGIYMAAEASARNTQLTLGKSATLIKDVSETDRFGRLLRYVVVDNIFVNYELVVEGYARAVSYPPDTACIAAFRSVAEKASASQLGLWAPQPRLIALPTAPKSGGSGPCSCSGPDLNCPAFGTHAKAQACYDYCKSAGFGDVFNLDSDADGRACESLP